MHRAKRDGDGPAEGAAEFSNEERREFEKARPRPRRARGLGELVLAGRPRALATPAPCSGRGAGRRCGRDFDRRCVRADQTALTAPHGRRHWRGDDCDAAWRHFGAVASRNRRLQLLRRGWSRLARRATPFRSLFPHAFPSQEMQATIGGVKPYKEKGPEPGIPTIANKLMRSDKGQR